MDKDMSLVVRTGWHSGKEANFRLTLANYFVARASNGRVEGFNTGVRSILRRAFGMLNFEHFRLRVLDRFGVPRPT
jgi:hypothetical protein